MLESKTKIVVTVDDFGPRADVNERALAAFQAGSITRVSALVNIPWPVGTVEMLKASGIPVGLHLNISSGRALAPIDRLPSLVDSEGNFLARNKSRDLSPIDPAEIKEEFAAQLRYFRALGLTLSHLDNHRPEIYFYPKLMEAALNIARDEHVSFRHPLRNISVDDIRLLAGKLGCSEKDISELKLYYDDALAKKGVSCPDYFLADTSFGGCEQALDVIASKDIRGYCEVAVHLEGDMGTANLEFMLSSMPGLMQRSARESP